MTSKDNWKYLQFNKIEGTPVFIQCDKVLLNDDLSEVLKDLHFFEVTPTEFEESYASHGLGKRILRIIGASPKVRQQIGVSHSLDQYGSETLKVSDGYNLYHYRGLGMLVYSLASDVWELGLSKEGRDREAYAFALRTVLTRYLSWSLAPLGVIGFWSVKKPAGLIVCSQKDSNSYANFIDIKKLSMIGNEGYEELDSEFNIYRVDSSLGSRVERKMRAEELLSFLYTRCSYFNPAGPTIPIRQMIQTISRISSGRIISKDLESSSSSLSL